MGLPGTSVGMDIIFYHKLRGAGSNTRRYNKNGDENLSSWDVRRAKARFSEFLDAALDRGPQVVTRRGIDTAVLVSIEQWEQLQQAARPGLKDLLLAPEPRFDNLIAPRRKWRRRAVVRFK